MACSPNHFMSLALALMVGYKDLISSSGYSISFSMVAESVIKSGVSASGKASSTMERVGVRKYACAFSDISWNLECEVKCSSTC